MGSNPYINSYEGAGQDLVAGEDLTSGQLVAILDSDGYVYAADADDATLRPAIGIVEMDTDDEAHVEIKMRGRVTNESSLAEGKPVYLSQTAGDVTQTPEGPYCQAVGIAVSTTDYVLCIQPPLSLVVLTFTVAGDITANDLANWFLSAPLAGKVLDVGIRAANTGGDGTDDLAIAGDVNIGGTTCMTTLPALTDSATDGVDTFEAATGVTIGVVNPAANDFDRGDELTWDLDLTRTTPEDEMADVTVIVVLGLGAE